MSFLLLTSHPWNNHNSSTVAAVTILMNATFYTVDLTNPLAKAILLSDSGVITGIGTEREILQQLEDQNITSPTVVNLERRFVMPAFHDVNVYGIEAALKYQVCPVPIGALPYEIAYAFDACRQKAYFGDQGWMVGMGLDLVHILDLLLDPYEQTPRTILDDRYPTTPVLVLDNLGHGAIANTLALQAAGYNDASVDPKGGKLHRNPDTGVLTGIVLEHAQHKLRDAAFPPTPNNTQAIFQGLLQMMQELNKYGVTTISSAGGYWTQAGIEAWSWAEQRKAMTVRAFNSLYVYPDKDVTTQLAQLQDRVIRNESSMVQFNQAEISVDGVLPLLTSALFQPYEDYLLLPEDEQFGFEYWGNQSNLNQVARQVSNAGFPLILYAHGDRAVRWAIEAIEQANMNVGQHRVSGNFLVADDDWWKFASANAVADFQLTPDSLSQKYETFVSDLIGPERASQLEPARKVYDYGATVTLSSAFKRAPVNPILKIDLAINRPNATSLYDLETIIPMMTINPARLLRQENKTGSIEVGKLADLVILDENFFQMDKVDIHTVQVHATLLQGRAVFDPMGIFGDPYGSLDPKLERRSAAEYSTMSGWISLATVWLLWTLTCS
jgi:predicted amidohydrolase YtcJ